RHTEYHGLVLPHDRREGRLIAAGRPDQDVFPHLCRRHRHYRLNTRQRVRRSQILSARLWRYPRRGRLAFRRDDNDPTAEMIRLFRVSIPVGVLALLVSEIALTSCCFLTAAYWYWQADLATYFLYDGGLIRNFLVVATIILASHFSDLYTRIHVKSK